MLTEDISGQQIVGLKAAFPEGAATLPNLITVTQ